MCSTRCFLLLHSIYIFKTTLICLLSFSAYLIFFKTVSRHDISNRPEPIQFTYLTLLEAQLDSRLFAQGDINMLFNFILLVSLLSDIAHSKAIPSALEYSHRGSLRPADIQKRGNVHGDCKKLKPFFDQTSRDWRDHNTDEWFQAWWTNHRKVKGTFTEVWGTEVLGNPDWCLNGDCAFRPCDISVPTDNDDDLRHAYYVTEAVSRLHSYFDDLSEAFRDSAIWAAFAKDKWSLTFHPDEHESKTVTKAGLISVGFVIAIAFAFGGVAGPLEAAFAGSGTALWSAGQSSLMTFDVHKDHSVTDAADLGAALGELVLASSKELVNADNLLMQGRVVSQSGDIRRFLRGGYWVDYKGLDRTKLVDNLAGFLLGNAINRIWRTQEVYIVGGPRCDRDDNG